MGGWLEYHDPAESDDPNSSSLNPNEHKKLGMDKESRLTAIMVTQQEEEYIREKAYVPEHVIPLMVGISQAEPFFQEDYLFFLKDGWMTFVGYPLGGDFREEAFSAILEKVQKKLRPSSLWFITPGIPESLLPRVQKRETDEYYRLDLRQSGVKRSLQREVEKASLALRVEKHRDWSPEHESLTREFLEKENLTPRVRELYLRIPQVLAHSETSMALSARDSKENLSAFFVVEMAAQKFATYVAGCYSLSHYVSHASDLLFHEMIGLARENGKEYIHVGLGVNEGIRRFKKKWGGVPDLPYLAGEITPAEKTTLSWLRALASKI